MARHDRKRPEDLSSNNRGKNKDSYTASCSGCSYVAFSHESQSEANRFLNNHWQRCEGNPDNDPDAIR